MLVSEANRYARVRIVRLFANLSILANGGISISRHRRQRTMDDQLIMAMLLEGDLVRSPLALYILRAKDREKKIDGLVFASNVGLSHKGSATPSKHLLVNLVKLSSSFCYSKKWQSRMQWNGSIVLSGEP